MRFFVLNAPRANWGDYGSILVHGMACHRPRTDDGLIQLERAGPYVPPISFPGGGIIITDAFREDLLQSRLSGLEFRPVVIAHMARLDWRSWDQSAFRPPCPPGPGEPEDYVLANPHDPELARAVGPLWEIRADVHPGATVTIEEDTIRLAIEQWDGRDFFHGDSTGYFFASPRARDWLSAVVPDHVVLSPVETLRLEDG